MIEMSPRNRKRHLCGRACLHNRRMSHGQLLYNIMLSPRSRSDDTSELVLAYELSSVSNLVGSETLY